MTFVSICASAGKLPLFTDINDVLITKEYMRLLIAVANCNCTQISTRVYALEPYARFRTGQGGLRGRRSTGYEESEIDKAHVLHAAESPWLEVSTVGLSCRLLIAGTMQQMALIAIPTHGLPALEFSFVLSLPHLEQSSFFFRPFRRRRRRRRFSRILLLAGLLPANSIPTSRDSMCSISSRRQAYHLSTEDIILGFHPGHCFRLIGCTLES